MNAGRTIQTHPTGVLLSEAAFDVGLAALRKRQDQATQWFVVSSGEGRFAVLHRTTAQMLRGPSGRLSTFSTEEAAEGAARKANAS